MFDWSSIVLINSLRNPIFIGVIVPFLATFAGVLSASYIAAKGQKEARKRAYKKICHALKLELENNIKLVDDKKWAPISFETFKLAFGSEIFIEHAEDDLGPDFLRNLWHVISELRKMKTDSEKGIDTRALDLEISKYKSGSGYEELKKVIQVFKT